MLFKFAAKVIQKNDIIIFNQPFILVQQKKFVFQFLKNTGLKYINEENKNKITKGFF